MSITASYLQYWATSLNNNQHSILYASKYTLISGKRVQPVTVWQSGYTIFNCAWLKQQLETKFSKPTFFFRIMNMFIRIILRPKLLIDVLYSYHKVQRKQHGPRVISTPTTRRRFHATDFKHQDFKAAWVDYTQRSCFNLFTNSITFWIKNKLFGLE